MQRKLEISIGKGKNAGINCLNLSGATTGFRRWIK